MESEIKVWECRCQGLPRKGMICPYIKVGLKICGAREDFDCPYKQEPMNE